MGRAKGDTHASTQSFGAVFGTRRGPLDSDMSAEAVLSRMRRDGDATEAYGQWRERRRTDPERHELYHGMVENLLLRQQDRWARQIERTLTAFGVEPDEELIAAVWRQTHNWAAECDFDDPEKLPAAANPTAALDDWMDTWMLPQAIALEICHGFARNPKQYNDTFGQPRLRALRERLAEHFPGLASGQMLWDMSGYEWDSAIARVGGILKERSTDGTGRFEPGVSADAVKDALAEGVFRELTKNDLELGG